MDLKQKCPGMLGVRVYSEIYKRVYRLPYDLDIVEVGAGAGASTIAIAWGMYDAGRRSSVVSVEKCEGGSRATFGDKSDNMAILERNLVEFGVRHRVRLFTESLTFANGEAVQSLIQTEKVGALLCDADGRIHRDLRLFLPMLAPNALIVIDDYEESGSPKQQLTYELLNHFEDVGILKIDAVIENTAFCYATSDASVHAVDMEYCSNLASQFD